MLAQRLQARPEHLARRCAHEGRLLLAGPCPVVDSEDPGPAGFSGSVVIAQFESLPRPGLGRCRPKRRRRRIHPCAGAAVPQGPAVNAGAIDDDALQQARPQRAGNRRRQPSSRRSCRLRDGRGHFNVHVVSERFAGWSAGRAPRGLCRAGDDGDRYPRVVHPRADPRQNRAEPLSHAAPAGPSWPLPRTGFHVHFGTFA